MALRRHSFAVLFAALCIHGCSGGQSASTPMPDNENDASGGSSDCMTQACDCSNGTTGTGKACSGQAPATCDCGGCSAFQPSAAPAFTACGGEPFGLWISTPTLQAEPTGPLGSKCPVNVTAVEPLMNGAPILLLDLASGGSAALSLTPPQLDYTVEKQCAELDPVDGDCTTLQSTDSTLSCTEGTCGTCLCTDTAATASIGSALNLDGSWTRSGTQLTVTGNGVTFIAQYCVQGNTMTLEDSGGGVYQLTQGYVGGTATDCASRSSATCVEGCYLGECVGGSSCSGTGIMSACLTIEGCSWSASTCTGTPSACDWTSTAPGCLVGAYGTACAGTPTDCSTLDSTTCASSPGCTPMGTCVGGTFDCSDVPESICTTNDVTGCYYSSYVYGTVGCTNLSTGPTNPPCDGLTSQTICEGASCTWQPCTGTAEPCEFVSAAECSSHPGCFTTGDGEGGAEGPDAGGD
jgi:hypothetical protein